MANFNLYKPGTMPSVINQAYKQDRRYALAQALQQSGMDTGPAATPLAGLARLVQAGVGAYKQKGLEKEYNDRGEEYRKTLAQFLDSAKAGQPDYSLLAQNPDTADFGFEAQLKMLTADKKDKGRILTADEASQLTNGAIQVPSNLKPDGTLEPISLPPVRSAAPGSTIFGYGGSREELPNTVPAGFKRDENGNLMVDPNWLGTEKQLRSVGPTISAGGQLAAAGIDAGGPAGGALVNQGLGMINGQGGQLSQPAPQGQPPLTQDEFTSRFTPGSLAPPSPAQYPPQMSREGLNIAQNDIPSMVAGMPSKTVRQETAKTQVENVNNAIKFGTQAQGFGEKAKLYDLAIDSLGTGDVGPASKFVLAGKKLANNMGADFNTTPANMVDAMNKEFTSIMQFDSENGRVFSGSLSNSDREFFQQRAPGLSDDIPSLKLKKEMLDKANQRSAEIGRIGLQYRNDPAGFERARQSYIDSHPLFDSAFRHKVDQTMKLGSTQSKSGIKFLGFE